jgi:hypothetical protein
MLASVIRRFVCSDRESSWQAGFVCVLRCALPRGEQHNDTHCACREHKHYIIALLSLIHNHQQLPYCVCSECSYSVEQHVH